MIPAGEKRDTRRQFLLLVGRTVAAVAVAAVAALLAGRRIGSGQAGRCGWTNPCGKCFLFDECELPRATAARTTIRKANTSA